MRKELKKTKINERNIERKKEKNEVEVDICIIFHN